MYRICIHIIRHTNAGRALQLMAAGLSPIESPTHDDARRHLDRYLDCAEPLLAAADKGTCFGMVAILDTTTGDITYAEALIGKGTVLRVEVHQRGRVVTN